MSRHQDKQSESDWGHYTQYQPQQNDAISALNENNPYSISTDGFKDATEIGREHISDAYYIAEYNELNAKASEAGAKTRAIVFTILAAVFMFMPFAGIIFAALGIRESNRSAGYRGKKTTLKTIATVLLCVNILLSFYIIASVLFH